MSPAGSPGVGSGGRRDGGPCVQLNAGFCGSRKAWAALGGVNLPRMERPRRRQVRGSATPQVAASAFPEGRSCRVYVFSGRASVPLGGTTRPFSAPSGVARPARGQTVCAGGPEVEEMPVTGDWHFLQTAVAPHETAPAPRRAAD